VDVDELYGLPLERFTPERNALARELRKSGERERAAEVAALRKPSVAAWAVNQLVRTQRRGLGELFDAGTALRAAHDAVLAGRGDGSSLRAAVEAERVAAEALAGAARGLLTSDGHELSPTILERVSDTLHAAALDDEAREQVREGRLERELRHVGLGMMAAASGAAPAPAPKKRAEERRADEERAAARVVEREARRRLERAERAATVASERRDRAAAALSEAEAELVDAEAERDEAEAGLREAERALGD